MFGFSVCLLANLESADRTFPFPYLLIYLFFCSHEAVSFPFAKGEGGSAKKLFALSPLPPFRLLVTFLRRN